MKKFIDEFIKVTGIELLPFQKEILEKMADGNKVYILYPPKLGRENTILLMRGLARLSISDIFKKEKENID